MKKTVKLIVILALLGGGGYWYYNAKIKKAEKAITTYDRAKVEIRDLRTTVESTGEIKPRNRLDVKPPIAGRLEELLVDEGDEVTKGQILGWISSTERATLLDAALATSEEELAYWEDLYKPSPLISPLRGTIIARNFEPGQSIGANDAVVVIADDLIVVANLDETDIGQVKLGQAVETRLESYPDLAFDGEVEKIAYDAKTISNVTMYEVDVRPVRVPPYMRSGMTANLEFVIAEKKGALVVPASAIQTKTGGKSGGGGGERPNFSDMSDEERKAAMVARMKERGMSDAEIKENLARFAQGGGSRGGRGGGGGGSLGGKKGGAKKSGSSEVSYVLTASDDPENPSEKIVKVGLSDGSYTEIVEGLEEGAEVLIRKVNLGSASSGGGGSSFMTGLSGRGGRR
jgi:macrolide-specific efflux system membrane fusion protein